MDCYASDREFLADFEKYFNNAYLSDVTLIVGDEVSVTFDYYLLFIVTYFLL